MTYPLPYDWANHLAPEFNKSYMHKLQDFLQDEHEARYKIYPPMDKVFAAYNHTPLTKVKVVLLGLDPYHVVGQAMGLSFSVDKDVKIPPSLKRMFNELVEDQKVPMPTSGDLTPWADQGVLLLNSVLTVRDGTAGSHANKGWETFTDKTLSVVSEQTDKTAFILLGNYARNKKHLIDNTKHLIFEAAHPSPLARTGFIGTKPYSTVNKWLSDNGVAPIDWRLP